MFQSHQAIGGFPHVNMYPKKAFNSLCLAERFPELTSSKTILPLSSQLKIGIGSKSFLPGRNWRESIKCTPPSSKKKKKKIRPKKKQECVIFFFCKTELDRMGFKTIDAKKKKGILLHKWTCRWQIWLTN